MACSIFDIFSVAVVPGTRESVVGILEPLSQGSVTGNYDNDTSPLTGTMYALSVCLHC